MRGEVPEWLKGADCKSAGLCLRRFESFPLHHAGASGAREPKARTHRAGIAQLVEHQPSKLRVAGSSPVSRSTRCGAGGDRRSRGMPAHVAQSVEHFLGKEEVTVRIRSWAPARAGGVGESDGDEERSSDGQGEVRSYEAARERGDDRSRGPREDDVDGGDHDDAGEEESEGGGAVVRVDRQRAGGEGARDHDQRGARGVRDGERVTTRTWIARVTRTTSRT